MCKVILSVRSSDDSIHVGRMLAKSFEKGSAGGHKALAGGQIPFDELGCKNPQEAMESITKILKSAFGGE